ncbi:50S ribosomal protein L29 [bacterium 336/3]|jgi:large subunit ribosomal protein L29|nr:50S ribosomal protein L29 [bacterium 336/3]
MKAVDLKKLSLDELKAKLTQEQDALLKLKMAHAITPVENPMRIREARKVVARIQTVIREKELAK